ncbi:MAG: SelT/SelW/SelH family protein [Verrucomicrobia bacterium]|nr:SelT/SelW/SelH family protein [Verrucomicrobiota bacterium]MCH8528705.1 SelT/SelW/SelH family protein [Kiritimatiellia bacterium]
MSKKPLLEIEYCTGCRWMMRAAWTAQELLNTFENDLGGVSLLPSETGGRFQVRCGEHVLHDRKSDSGFIELKVLKQRVRDHLFPDRDLGHSGGGGGEDSERKFVNHG